MPVGRRYVWSARSIMSKPSRPLEPCVKTDSLNWDCPAPLIDAVTAGHEVVPDETKQTIPATVIDKVTERDSAPLLPVTWTVNVPVEFVVIVRVAVPAPLMLAGFTTAPIPAELTVVKETVPENPLNPVTVMVDVAKEPAGMLRLLGLAVTAKSGVADPASNASPIEIQLPGAESRNVTDELVAKELTRSYSTALFPIGVIIVNPGWAVGKAVVFRCRTAAKIISLGLLVEILTDVLPLFPLAVPGKAELASNGLPKFAPLTPKAIKLL